MCALLMTGQSETFIYHRGWTDPRRGGRREESKPGSTDRTGPHWKRDVEGHLSVFYTVEGFVLCIFCGHLWDFHRAEGSRPGLKRGLNRLPDHTVCLSPQYTNVHVPGSGPSLDSSHTLFLCRCSQSWYGKLKKGIFHVLISQLYF